MSEMTLRFLVGVSSGLCIIASAEVGHSWAATIFGFCAGVLFAGLVLTYDDSRDGDGA